MSVEVDIVYKGDLLCEAVHGPSGNVIVTDAPVDNGGKGSAFSPTDLVGTALGSCIVTIMGLMAKRKGLDIDGTQVNVVKDMAAVPVRRIGALTVTITLPAGKVIAAEDRVRLENAAKTCPVKQSLHPDTQVNLKFIYPD
ncbi:MAG TPA: OsmC family protein [Candidatus Hydrogenedentes bacterium]|nr:OsmC family protein [Candidatus Hydrogenedentota bacterium]